MIKIKIHELEKHRVETTFRPFLYPKTRNEFKEIGIKFITQGDDWDMCWVAHPTFSNKYTEYQKSVETGIREVEKLTKQGDVFLFDGSDSASLMGTWDVFKNTKAKKLFKNSIYSDLFEYSKVSKLGRTYWGLSVNNKDNYSIPMDEIYSDRFNDIELSGCNWLSTIQPQWFDYSNIHKEYDICALFSFPCKENFEWGVKHSDFYDDFRRIFVEILHKNKLKYNIKMLENGVHLPPTEYYKIMQKSKIVFAPFGYGEMAPRDIEAVMFGSILMKPDMSHIDTIPNVYTSSTFAAIRWDGSDMIKAIEMILNDFSTSQKHYTESMRNNFVREFNPSNLVRHTYDWISKLDGYGNE